MRMGVTAQEPAPARARPGAAVHISVSAEVAIKLRGEAKRHKVRPQVLASALLKLVLTENLTESVLDGADPARVAAPKSPGRHGLTYLRCAVLHTLAMSARLDGVVPLNTVQIARRAGIDRVQRCRESLVALEARCLVERAGRRGDGYGIWAVTPAGMSVAADLAGTGFANGRPTGCTGR